MCALTIARARRARALPAIFHIPTSRPDNQPSNSHFRASHFSPPLSRDPTAGPQEEAQGLRRALIGIFTPTSFCMRIAKKNQVAQRRNLVAPPTACGRCASSPERRRRPPLPPAMRSSLCLLLAAQGEAALITPCGLHRAAAPAVTRLGRVAMDGEADSGFGLEKGQKFGPTSPAHPFEKYARPHRLMLSRQPATTTRPPPLVRRIRELLQELRWRCLSSARPMAAWRAPTPFSPAPQLTHAPTPRRPWTNLEKQEDVQLVKARSDGLRVRSHA